MKRISADWLPAFLLAAGIVITTSQAQPAGNTIMEQGTFNIR
jgi:hypothetical protein